MCDDVREYYKAVEPNNPYRPYRAFNMRGKAFTWLSRQGLKEGFAVWYLNRERLNTIERINLFYDADAPPTIPGWYIIDFRTNYPKLYIGILKR